MKKTLLTMLFGVVVASVAHSEVMYWMVGDDYSGATEAKLYAVNGNTATAIDTRTQPEIYNTWDAQDSFYTSLGSSAGSGWSYYVEVVNGGNTYTTEAISYSAAKDGGFIYSNVMSLPPSQLSIPNGGFGGGATAYNVPEPTSGLLFLVGGMLLGLKRRRQV